MATPRSANLHPRPLIPPLWHEDGSWIQAHLSRGLTLSGQKHNSYVPGGHRERFRLKPTCTRHAHTLTRTIIGPGVDVWGHTSSPSIRRLNPHIYEADVAVCSAWLPLEAPIYTPAPLSPLYGTRTGAGYRHILRPDGPTSLQLNAGAIPRSHTIGAKAESLRPWHTPGTIPHKTYLYAPHTHPDTYHTRPGS